jgi:multidrug transporter EmrE-like cation transporter
MNATSFALILAGVLLNAAAQLLLKAGTNALGVLTLGRGDWAETVWAVATNPHIVAGLACYVVSVGVWIGALSRVEVSVAYPMLSIGYVVNAAAAWYLFGEALTMQRWIGIGFIAVGVWLLVRSA